MVKIKNISIYIYIYNILQYLQIKNNNNQLYTQYTYIKICEKNQ